MLLYILDDDTIELAFWAETLRTKHPEFRFELFTDCGAFKSSVIKTPPAACVIDMIMPYHPGTEVCEWLQHNAGDVPVFFNTSLAGDEYQVLADKCHATYMCKTKMSFSERLEVVVNGCKS